VAGSELLQAMIDAAKAGDADTVRRMIDWPLSGAAEMLYATSVLPEDERADAASDGLVEIQTAGDRPDVVGYVLAEQAEFLVPATAVESAQPWERLEALAGVRVPPTPAGLTPEQEVTVDGLRDRSVPLTEVWIAVGAGYRQPYVFVPDTGKLAILLD